MRKTSFPPLSLSCLLAMTLALTTVSASWADGNADSSDAAEKDWPVDVVTDSSSSSDSTDAKTTSTSTTKSKRPSFASLLGDVEAISGLIKLYRKDGKLYGEIPNSLLNKDFMVIISIARGIGEGSLLGGMSWGFGDDWIWQFRKTDQKIQIVRRNVRFRAAKDSPQEKAVRLAYTDSVLFSLPIATTNPKGTDIVELTSVFMSDLPNLTGAQGFCLLQRQIDLGVGQGV